MNIVAFYFNLFIFVSLTLRMFIMKTARIATIDVFRALTMF